MRKLAEPPPTTKCGRCGNQLILNRVEALACGLALNSDVYQCAKCGSEQAFTSQRDFHGARIGLRHAQAERYSLPRRQ